MLKKVISAVLIISFIVLFIPIPSSPLRDGGTRAYSALTYKIVKWNKIYSQSLYSTDATLKKYQNTSVFWFPENFTDYEMLWEKEEKSFEQSIKPLKQFGGNNVKEVGESLSDDKDFYIYLKGGDLTCEKPYIEIVWKNLSNKEKCINPYDYDILYSENKKETDISKFNGCYLKLIRNIILPALIIPANGEESVKYSLEDFDLSKTDGLYCFVSMIAEMQNGDDKFSKLYFEIY